jgi:hypothetical protein
VAGVAQPNKARETVETRTKRNGEFMLKSFSESCFNLKMQGNDALKTLDTSLGGAPWRKVLLDTRMP